MRWVNFNLFKTLAFATRVLTGINRRKYLSARTLACVLSTALSLNASDFCVRDKFSKKHDDSRCAH